MLMRIREKMKPAPSLKEGAGGIAAYEAYPTAMVTLGYGAVDFINSYLPGIPTFTQPGVAGAAASHVIEHFGVVVDAASELYGHLDDVTF